MENIKYLTGETFFDSDQDAFYTHIYTGKNKPPFVSGWGLTSDQSKENAAALVVMMDTVKLMLKK